MYLKYKRYSASAVPNFKFQIRHRETNVGIWLASENKNNNAGVWSAYRKDDQRPQKWLISVYCKEMCLLYCPFQSSSSYLHLQLICQNRPQRSVVKVKAMECYSHFTSNIEFYYVNVLGWTMEGNTIKYSLYLKSFKKINFLYMDKKLLLISTVLFKFHLSNEMHCFIIRKSNALYWSNPILNTVQGYTVASIWQGNLSSIDLSNWTELKTDFFFSIPTKRLGRNSASLKDAR